MTSRTRRGVLGLLATAAVASSPASAAIDSETTPDHVSITFDRDRLATYQPLLKMDIDARDALTGVYGYIATSDEWDRDVLCYWARYSVQESGRPWDSHQYDHEPVYVYLLDGDVDTVVYTGYHHYAARVDPDPADLSDDYTAEATHISLDVVSPWHHYRYLEGDEGVRPDLYDWTAARSEWEEYGFYDGTSREAVDVPRTMLSRESWWADGEVDGILPGVWIRLGLALDNRDDLETET